MQPLKEQENRRNNLKQLDFRAPALTPPHFSALVHGFVTAW
jgi:hypothetical protein